jgi:hypothetical protein
VVVVVVEWGALINPKAARAELVEARLAEPCNPPFDRLRASGLPSLDLPGAGGAEGGERSNARPRPTPPVLSLSKDGSQHAP